jgi:aspartate dehydrogenase
MKEIPNHERRVVAERPERKDKFMKAAIVGYGAIGKTIADAILAERVAGLTLVAVAEVRRDADLVRLGANRRFAVVDDPEAVLAYSPDIVIEAAEQEVVRRHAAAFLAAGAHMMIISVGALADAVLLAQLTQLAAQHNVRIIVPSGALGGLDAIKSARAGDLTDVTITNIKPPAALEGAPFIVRNRIDLGAIDRRTTLFEGFADEAAREFPKNLNVAVATSLAGIGLEKTRVILIVDPTETLNIHEIKVRGDFGEATFTTCGLPSPDNPRTSHLAALSAIATLANLAAPLQVGT